MPDTDANQRSPRARTPNHGPEADARAVRQSRAIATGDRAAFGDFYDQWFDRVFGQARSLCGRDESFCLDVVQETMLRVVRSLRPVRSASQLESWLMTVTRSAAIDALRREARSLRSSAVPQSQHRDDRTQVDPNQHADTAERIAWIHERLESLDAQDRELLASRILRGSTLARAGDEHAMTHDAVHGRLRRILQRLAAAAKEAFDAGH